MNGWMEGFPIHTEFISPAAATNSEGPNLTNESKYPCQRAYLETQRLLSTRCLFLPSDDGVCVLVSYTHMLMWQAIINHNKMIMKYCSLFGRGLLPDFYESSCVQRRASRSVLPITPTPTPTPSQYELDIHSILSVSGYPGCWVSKWRNTINLL